MFGSRAKPGLYRGDRGEYDGELAAFGERGGNASCGLAVMKSLVSGVEICVACNGLGVGFLFCADADQASAWEDRFELFREDWKTV